MIILTKVEWRREKDLDPLVKEQIEAKAEIVKNYDPVPDLYEYAPTDAIIDTDREHLYVQSEPGKIVMTKLLQDEYIATEEGLEKLQQQLHFEGDLEEIFKELTT